MTSVYATVTFRNVDVRAAIGVVARSVRSLQTTSLDMKSSHHLQMARVDCAMHAASARSNNANKVAWCTTFTTLMSGYSTPIEPTRARRRARCMCRRRRSTQRAVQAIAIMSRVHCERQAMCATCAKQCHTRASTPTLDRGAYTITLTSGRNKHLSKQIGHTITASLHP